MDIISILQAVLRRWYITVPVVLSALLVAWLVGRNVPPQYEAQGEILLASPQMDPAGLPRTVVDVAELAGRLAVDDVRDRLVEGSATLEAVADATSISLVIASPSASEVDNTSQNVVEWVQKEVDERQHEAGIDPAERLRASATSVEISDEVVDTEDEGDDESDYKVRTTITLQDPADAIVNPYGATNQTVRLLTVVVQSDEGRRRVEARTGADINYTLAQDPRDPAPIMGIWTYGSDPDAVLEGFDHVREVVAEELRAREERAAVTFASAQTRVETLAAPLTVTDVSPPIDRSVAVIVGLGGLVAVALALFVESVAQRRAPQRAASAEQLQLWNDHPEESAPPSRPVNFPFPLRQSGEAATPKDATAQDVSERTTTP